MKCCTGQQRKGNMIHTLTFTGIEGREVLLIELCCLKLFKGTHSLFDIFGWSKYPKQNHSDTLEESTVTQYIQGWANRTLYNVFLINRRLTALLLCSTQLCSAGSAQLSSLFWILPALLLCNLLFPRSGEITPLSPMWPGFKSRCRRHMWVKFVVGSLLCSERFSSGHYGQKPAFQNFDSICGSVTSKT